MQDDTQAPHAAHLAALDRLVALADDLAARIHAAATADEPTLTLEQASTALDRTARTLRRCVLLHRRLREQPPARPHPDRTTARRQVIRAVEDAIHRTPAAGEHPALRAELQERLDRPDMEQDLLSRPIPELIEELARDLGVAMPGRSFVFPRRTPADIDHLLARALGPPPSFAPPSFAPRPPAPGRPAPRPERERGTGPAATATPPCPAG